MAKTDRIKIEKNIETMSYIIIWRNNHREPFVDTTDDREFLNDFSTFEKAKASAEETIKDNPNSEWFIDYAIYEEAKN